MSEASEKRQIFHTNMLLLGFDPSFAQSHPAKRIAFNVDMFKVPNKAGFEVVIYFLFQRLNPSRARDEFRNCWPVRDKKSEQTFRRICNGWLSQIAQDESDSHLPKIVPSIFQSPGGDRFSNLMFVFSTYVLSTVTKNEHGVREEEMLCRPILTPRNLHLAPAMVQALQCATIDNRKKFFDSIQTREALHKTWQNSAKEMLTEFRRLTKSVRQTEADIQALLSNHSDRGFSSPIRMDKGRKALTPASKHGKIFDVNVQSVRREEKIQKVRELWRTVEGFLGSTGTHQEVVSSILSGVVHKYVLRASDLDVRVPEMLLRECERELLKRDIGNTYKAGELDLVSVLHLWNLSMHLYLEKFEESDTVDLSQQLDELQPKVQALNRQLSGSRQLGSTLRDELIPGLKESICQMKVKLKALGGYGDGSRSKLGMSLQPNSPTLSFGPEKVSDADVQAAGLSFTPTILPPESTPDAVSRILNSVSKAVEPHVKAKSDAQNKENQTPTTSRGAPKGAVLSPLAQGKLRRARKGEYFDGGSQSFSNRLNKSVLSPNKRQLKESIEVSRVGSKQLTRVVPVEESIFSPTDDGTREIYDFMAAGEAESPKTSRVRVSRSAQNTKKSASTQRDEALGRLYAQVKRLPSLPPTAESPSDLLAARIAQSIIEDGDMDSPSRSQRLPSAEAYNVLDELGMSGFVKKDKVARTPDTSAADSTRYTGYSSIFSPPAARSQSISTHTTKGKEIYADLHQSDDGGVISDDTEKNIITVQTKDLKQSPSSSSDPDEGDNYKHGDGLPNMIDRQVEATTNISLPQRSLRRESQDSPRATKSTVSGVASGMSLKDFVSWTPERPSSSKSIGRMIVNSVLDEEPLFIEDSPVVGAPGADVDDLFDLLPSDSFTEELQNSSGFVPSMSQTDSTDQQGRNTGLINLSNCSDDESKAPTKLTMDEIRRKFKALESSRSNVRN